MLDLKKLMEQAAKTLKECEIAYKLFEDKTEANDEEGAKLAKEAYDAKATEYDAMKAKVEEAKLQAKRRDMLREIEELSAPADQNAANVAKTGLSGSRPATPIDNVSRADAHRDAFTKWMNGEEKALSDEQWELLKPTSAKVMELINKSKDHDAKASVVMPPSLIAKCLGLNYVTSFDLGSKYGGDWAGKVVTTINNATTNPSMANYLVPQEFRAQLQMLPMPMPAILNRVTMVPCQTGVVTFPGLSQTSSNEFGGVSFSWTQEAGAKPETEPVFTQTDITAYELCGYTEISDRALSRSALSLESILVNLFRPAMNYTLDNAIINGSGIAQPTGILNAAGIGSVSRQTAGTVTDTDLVNLKHAIKSYHRRGAMFFLGDDVEQALENTADTFGRPLFRASTAGGAYDRLVGYMYEIANNNPTIGEAGDVFFGDPAQYFLAMEEEITVAKSSDYKFRNNVVAFKVFMYVGGQPMHPRAFAKLSSATS